MFSSRWLLNLAVGFHSHIWVDTLLIKETKKAILIMFDDREIWLPKVWIKKIKHNRYCERSEAISIKISEYHWAKKS